MTQRALVLGAGGPAAESWSTGVIAGLADAGIDVRDADLFIGTSAGAWVAVGMASPRTTEALFERQVKASLQANEPLPQVAFADLKANIERAKAGGGRVSEILQRVGIVARTTAAGTGTVFNEMIAGRLLQQTWPAARIRVVAVDVDRGERRVFERSSGVELIDAVAASGAAPGVWPPVTIEGRRYMDGGTYSTANADLAAGFERVLVLDLLPGKPPMAAVTPETNVATMRRAGSFVEVVNPDGGTLAAFAAVHGNLLDPAVRENAARAGRAQGRKIAAERIAPLWYGSLAPA
jgi:NTE family protein